MKLIDCSKYKIASKSTFISVIVNLLCGREFEKDLKNDIDKYINKK